MGTVAITLRNKVQFTMYSVKDRYADLLHNAHVCNTMQALLRTQNLSEQECAVYCAENYMMLHTETQANVQYFANCDDLLHAMKQMSYIQYLNANMHDMFDIDRELAERAGEQINRLRLECEVL